MISSVMFKRARACALAAGLGLLALAAAHAAGDAVSVADDHTLLKDCRPWAPRGLSFFGRLVPRDWKTDGGTMAARDDFSRWTVDAVRAFGGDTIRLQVGMPFLDPESPSYNAAYLGDVRDAVAMARSAGLVVFVSMQWEGRTGVKPVEMLPKDSALRAWTRVGPVFAKDPGVVYELFNEPASPPQPGPGFWEGWRAGHQAIVDKLRALGSRNLLVADGLNGARMLQGAPALKDPLHQLAYGSHPYFGEDLASPAQWDEHFGRFAQDHAVIVTEWSHMARMCGAADGAAVDRFVDYLAAHHIGLIGYGADELRGSRLARRGPGGVVPTSFQGQACDAPGAGPGEAVRRLFEREAAADARATAAAACAAP